MDDVVEIFVLLLTSLFFFVHCWLFVVCKIPLLARALGLKAARPSTRATIGYLVYMVVRTSTRVKLRAIYGYNS